MTDRKEALDARFREQHEVRELRKATREEEDLATRAIVAFGEAFKRDRESIQQALDRSSSVAPDDLPVHFDGLSAQCIALQKYLTDSALFLPSFDIRQSQDIINKLELSMAEARAQYMPKKKFTFKSRTKQKEETAVVEPPAPTPTHVSAAAKLQLEYFGFQNRTGETLILNEAELRDRDVMLTNLTDCTVVLYGSASVAHIKALTRCTVCIGPLSRSLFIADCVDCTFAIACQQVRIHNTTNSSFYAHVTSHPIIEDCHHVFFAPNTWTYAEYQMHFHNAGLDLHKNNWNLVDDFKWLKHDQPSPNWSVIPEDKRRTSWDL